MAVASPATQHGHHAQQSVARQRRLAVRAALICSAPLLAVSFGLARWQLAFCAWAAAAWSVLEACIVYRVRAATTCGAVPFAMRFIGAVILDFQACWLLRGEPERSTGGLRAASVLRAGAQKVALRGLAAVETATDVPALSIRTLSIVLPCANEGGFVGRTVASVFSNTPPNQLHEIIVVDDGSEPPVSANLSRKFLADHRARILRHNISQGLIRSKKHGGDIAHGDVIVFLDCHVRPMGEWTEPILANIQENPKRVVVPAITSLDPDTWEETSPYGGGTKMCMTWQADFRWCNEYPGLDVPIMSGGLLAMSKYWWEAIGGYDDQMLSWGGENLDQSLRTWLCGGEIKVAEGSRVAHMWRDPEKPQTQLRYSIPTDDVRRNRLRAAQAWLGPWAGKVRTFPEFEDFREGGRLTVGSLANIHEYRDKLQCKDFDWYLDRFRDLYVGTGQFPEAIFHVRLKGSDLCLHHELDQGSSKGFSLVACDHSSEMQRFHAANSVPGDLGRCCSGLKAWDFDACLTAYEVDGDVQADQCSSFGDGESQLFQLVPNGTLRWWNSRGCVVPKSKAPKALPGPAAELVPGRECASRVEVAEGEGESWFRVVSGDLCLSGNVESESRLVFVPCAESGGSTYFMLSPKGDGDGDLVQLETSKGLCVDAASGRGPIAYPCHPAEQRGPSQLFAGGAGSALSWQAAEDGAYAEPFCVDVDPADKVVFGHCHSGQLPVRTGQRFLKHNWHEDGSFQLWHPDNDRCLDFREVKNVENDESELMLFTKQCTGGDSQRWRHQASGQLVNVASGLCVDANDLSAPALFRCYRVDDASFQRFVLHDNGLVEMPRTWGDNGRQRFPAQCLDSAPIKAPELAVVACEDPDFADITWERLWPKTPLETQLFLQRGHDL